jgi:hypothetical protein
MKSDSFYITDPVIHRPCLETFYIHKSDKYATLICIEIRSIHALFHEPGVVD